MTTLDSLSSISLDELRRVEAICTRFESAGLRGPQAIEACLAAYTGKHRGALLQELVLLDLEMQGLDSQGVDSDATGSLNASYVSGFASGDDQRIAELAVREFEANTQAAGEAGGKSQTSKQKQAATQTPPKSERYEVLQEVGRGGLGVIWQVHDRQTKRMLAIKCLRDQATAAPQAVARLQREAVLTGQLQHPGIPPIYESGRLDSGEYYFSMKLIEGRTLESILASRVSAADEQDRCLDIFLQVSQTIAYAHERSVIHRDIKPHNVMVGKFGEVQMLDWGLASVLDAEAAADPAPFTLTSTTSKQLATHSGCAAVDGDHAIESDLERLPVGISGGYITPSNLTTAGEVFGTPNHMAPEQARGEISAIDRRSDVFGLGTILFQILTNQRLHQDESATTALARTSIGDLGDALVRLAAADGPVELIELCRQTLQVERESRPKSAAELVERLQAVQTNLRERLERSKVESFQRQESIRRQRMLGAAAVALAAVVAVGAWAFAFQRSRALDARLQRVEAEARATRQLDTTNEVKDFLVKFVVAARPSADGEDVRVVEVMQALEPEIEERFAERPRIRGILHREFGETYRRLGDPQRSVEQFRLSIKALRSTEPFEELELLMTEDRLAGVLRAEVDNSLDEAAALRRHVVERRTVLLGENHPETAQAKGNLGVVLDEQGDFAAARELFEQALAATRLDPEIDPMEIVARRLNIYQVQAREQDFDSSIANIRGLIAEHADASKNRTVLVQIHFALAQICEMAGRLDEAEVEFRIALDLFNTFFGEDHPRTLSVRRKLCRLLVRLEHYADALEQLRVCVELNGREYGPAAGPTFEMRQYFARALVGNQQLDAAREYLQKTVDLLVDERGPDHRYTQQAREQLAEFDVESAVAR